MVYIYKLYKTITDNHCFLKVANAVGAALCQVSGCEEILLNMTGLSKTEALEKLRTRAFEKCLMNGAKRESIRVIDMFDVFLYYQPQENHYEVRLFSIIFRVP